MKILSNFIVFNCIIVATIATLKNSSSPSPINDVQQHVHALNASSSSTSPVVDFTNKRKNKNKLFRGKKQRQRRPDGAVVTTPSGVDVAQWKKKFFRQGKQHQQQKRRSERQLETTTALSSSSSSTRAIFDNAVTLLHRRDTTNADAVVYADSINVNGVLDDKAKSWLLEQQRQFTKVIKKKEEEEQKGERRRILQQRKVKKVRKSSKNSKNNYNSNSDSRPEKKKQRKSRKVSKNHRSSQDDDDDHHHRECYYEEFIIQEVDGGYWSSAEECVNDYIVTNGLDAAFLADGLNVSDVLTCDVSIEECVIEQYPFCDNMFDEELFAAVQNNVSSTSSLDEEEREICDRLLAGYYTMHYCLSVNKYMNEQDQSYCPFEEFENLFPDGAEECVMDFVESTFDDDTGTSSSVAIIDDPEGVFTCDVDITYELMKAHPFCFYDNLGSHDPTSIACERIFNGTSMFYQCIFDLIENYNDPPRYDDDYDYHYCIADDEYMPEEIFDCVEVFTNNFDDISFVDDVMTCSVDFGDVIDEKCPNFFIDDVYDDDDDRQPEATIVPTSDFGACIEFEECVERVVEYHNYTTNDDDDDVYDHYEEDYCLPEDDDAPPAIFDCVEQFSNDYDDLSFEEDIMTCAVNIFHVVESKCPNFFYDDDDIGYYDDDDTIRDRFLEEEEEDWSSSRSCVELKNCVDNALYYYNYDDDHQYDDDTYYHDEDYCIVEDDEFPDQLYGCVEQFVNNDLDDDIVSFDEIMSCSVNVVPIVETTCPNLFNDEEEERVVPDGCVRFQRCVDTVMQIDYCFRHMYSIGYDDDDDDDDDDEYRTYHHQYYSRIERFFDPALYNHLYHGPNDEYVEHYLTIELDAWKDNAMNGIEGNNTDRGFDYLVQCIRHEEY